MTDNCVSVSNADQADTDGDGDGDVCDNCVSVVNADQADANENEIGDRCENDADSMAVAGRDTSDPTDEIGGEDDLSEDDGSRGASDSGGQDSAVRGGQDDPEGMEAEGLDRLSDVDELLCDCRVQSRGVPALPWIALLLFGRVLLSHKRGRR